MAVSNKKVSKKKTASKKTLTKKKATSKKDTAVNKAKDLTSFDNFEPYKAKKGEEYMNAAQSEHFKAILLAWHKDLQEEVDRTVDHMQSDASNFSDPNDRATQEEEFALELRTRDRERKLTKKIRTSLADIESGDYGFCEVCGIEIGIQRLEARPTANLCIDCKTLDEIKEKQMS
ncbi:MAG: RNA polymerase-binding protein DksA [Gammaproteobacteria bacterium]